MTMTFDSPKPSRGWNIGLWVAQVALAGLYLMAASMKGLMPIADLAEMGMTWTTTAPVALVRGIALLEFLGAVGVILPAATRILPGVTVWAAAGLLAIQALAIPFHMIRGEFSLLPFNLLYAGLALLVLWGRSRKAPIPAR